ncbi:MAG: hypothetical protein QG635_1113 [Bacteroidota bacterium]|nr:hypothetical protein [Bacteroidota bacterium]
MLGSDESWNKDVMKIVIRILIVLLILGLLGGGGFYVYKYYPGLIGLGKKKAPARGVKGDTVYVDKTIGISERKLSMFEQGLIEKAALKQQKDSLLKVQKHYQDSISKVLLSVKQIQDSVLRINKRYNDLNKNKNFLYDSLLKVQNSLKNALEKVNVSQKMIQDQEKMITKKYDTLETQNFEVFAKLYNNSNPTDVAKILEQLDERDAAKILKLMTKKKAGKVIEALKPEQAAAILMLGGSD